MAIDPLTLQILANHFAAAAEAMAYTLTRTAHSTFVKETEDFSCGILTKDGLTFASPKALGATWYMGIDYSPAIRLIDSYEAGDICLTNDPYNGNVATHSPDVHIWKPIFHEDELICFVAGHIHNTDVGGAVPASLSRGLVEVQQEGLRIPPTKIFSQGKFNDDVLRIMAVNVRVPNQNWGDLNAQIASVNVGERKVLEIIERFGIEVFKQSTNELMAYAEAQARRIVRQIPNGSYSFNEYADEDSEGGYPCRVALTLRVADETLELDFTGSDPQLASALNVPTGGRERHALALVGLNYVLYTLDNNVLLNAGLLRVARAILPRGTVVHAVHPAAVGMRSLTCMLIQIATYGAFSMALPGRLPASPGASISVVNVKTINRRGKAVMASIGPVGGGGGGMPFADGPEGSGANTAFLKNTPVEINETEVPIRFLRYGLVPDTAGAGRYRGGLATIMEFEVFAPETVVTARNRDRSLFASWGVLGGRAGAVSSFTRNPGRSDELQLRNIDVVHCEPGDILRIVGPGAGGYGNPLDRDPASVLHDVQCGFVNSKSAIEQYGVVIKNGQLDLEETGALRAQRHIVTSFGHFDFGTYRDEFEEVWNKARYDALTEVLSKTQIMWRFFVKKAIFDAVAAAKQDNTEPDSQIRAIFDKLVAQFPQLIEEPIEIASAVVA